MTTDATDASLLARARAGGTDAFAALVERYQNLVCAVTYALTGDREASEDLAQETFLTAWRSLDALREPEAFRGWLCGIARNLGHKARRRRREEDLADTDGPPVDEAPIDEALAEHETRAIVWQALERMPAGYREALVLYYREGCSTGQVARALGISVSAVEQRLSRGRKHLRAGVERIVESTLTRTRPGSGFAMRVLAVLPARDLLPITPSAAFDASSPNHGVLFMNIAIVATVLLTIGGAIAFVLPGDQGPTSETSATPTEPTAAEPAPSSSRAASSAHEEQAAKQAFVDRQIDRARAAEAATVREPATSAPRYELTEMAIGRYAVHLDGGPSSLHTGAGLGAPAAPPPVVRHVRGVVRDAAGRPVAGAVLLGGHSISGYLGRSLAGQAGATTGSDGSFDLELRTDKAAVVLAMHGTIGWSPVLPVAGGTANVSLDPTLAPPAAMRGTLTRGGEPFSGQVVLRRLEDKRSFLLAVPAAADGKFSEARVPAGTFEAVGTQGLSTGNGAGGMVLRTVELSPGKTTTIDLDIATGGLVAIDARLPDEHTVVAMQFTLLPGRHTFDDAAQIASKRERLGTRARVMLQGGSDLDEVMQFHDVPLGDYTACAEAVARAKVVLGSACRAVEIASDGDVVEIVLAALSDE